MEYLRESSQSVVGKVEDRERLGLPGLGQGLADLPRLAGLHSKLEQSSLSSPGQAVYIILKVLQQRKALQEGRHFSIVVCQITRRITS